MYKIIYFFIKAKVCKESIRTMQKSRSVLKKKRNKTKTIDINLFPGFNFKC